MQKSVSAVKGFAFNLSGDSIGNTTLRFVAVAHGVRSAERTDAYGMVLTPTAAQKKETPARGASFLW